MMNDDLKRVVGTVNYVEARDLVQRMLDEPTLIDTMRPILAKLYREGDDEQKRCVVDGILEHLFEAPGVEGRFREWQTDPELSIAFSEARQWAEPVTKKREFLTAVANLCVEEMRREGIDATVKVPDIGIDSVEIELRDSEDTEHLILDCDYELIEKFRTDIQAQMRLAKHAADRRNWAPDEYAPWQQWVQLHE